MAQSFQDKDTTSDQRKEDHIALAFKAVVQ